MEAPRSNNNTASLGYSATEKGEPSRNGKHRKKIGKIIKTTCHRCGKLGHTKNVCKSTRNLNPKHKLKAHCHNCKNQGHKAHERRTKSTNTQRFEGYY